MQLTPGMAVPGPNGTTLTLDEMIGHGAFGFVWKAHDENGIVYAVKTVLTSVQDPQQQQTLTNEGEKLGLIVHPNVVQVLHFHKGTDGLPPYIVMEFAPDGTLADFIRTLSSGEKLDAGELIAHLQQLALGMRAINDALVHRDIKPDNILRQGATWRISDFGLSKMVDAATRAQSLKGINHVMFCAPEAWDVGKNTPLMDMYSMGCVFYQLATFRHPLEVGAAPNPVQAWKDAHLLQKPVKPSIHNPKVPPALDHLILSMLAKRPTDRPQTWDDVIGQLEKATLVAQPAKTIQRWVQKADAELEKAEQERLRREAIALKRREVEKLAEHGFTEVLDVLEAIGKDFNDHSPRVKLQIRRNDNSISLTRQGGSSLSAQLQVAPQRTTYRGKDVVAWGIVSGPKRGFNILLVRDSDEDLYGRWIGLAHNLNAFFQMPPRDEPFALSLGDLGRQLPHVGSMSRVESRELAFTREGVEGLGDDLFSGAE